MSATTTRRFGRGSSSEVQATGWRWSQGNPNGCDRKTDPTGVAKATPSRPRTKRHPENGWGPAPDGLVLIRIERGPPPPASVGVASATGCVRANGRPLLGEWTVSEPVKRNRTEGLQLTGTGGRHPEASRDRECGRRIQGTAAARQRPRCLRRTVRCSSDPHGRPGGLRQLRLSGRWRDTRWSSTKPGSTS